MSTSMVFLQYGFDFVFTGCIPFINCTKFKLVETGLPVLQKYHSR